MIAEIITQSEAQVKFASITGCSFVRFFGSLHYSQVEGWKVKSPPREYS